MTNTVICGPSVLKNPSRKFTVTLTVFPQQMPDPFSTGMQTDLDIHSTETSLSSEKRNMMTKSPKYETPRLSSCSKKRKMTLNPNSPRLKTNYAHYGPNTRLLRQQEMDKY